MKREDVFEVFEPPAGGLSALRARLEARPLRRLRFAPIAAFAMAAAALYVLSRPDAPDLVKAAGRHADPSAVALGLAPMPEAPVALAREQRGTTALAEVKTSNPDVAFYWASSTAWGE